MTKLAFSIAGANMVLAQELQIADTDAPRIMGYLMASNFGTVTENVQSETPDASWSPGKGETEKDRPMLQTQAWVTRPATPEETAANYARSVLADLLAQTVAHEKVLAAATAADAVTPITPIQPPAPVPPSA
jgi:hypothetical protein